MKKILCALAILSLVVFSYINIYATSLISNTPNDTLTVNPYYDTNPSMTNTFDSLSVGIVVASIVIIVGVIFFYLIPKE